MAEEPDRLRQDIENTRASLTRDVDMLAEKTSPKKVAQRRWTSVKEKVMGSSEHARHDAGDTRHRAGQGLVGDSTVCDKASQVGDKAGEKAQEVADSVRSAPRRSPSRRRATRSRPGSSRSASACSPPR